MANGRNKTWEIIGYDELPRKGGRLDYEKIAENKVLRVEYVPSGDIHEITIEKYYSIESEKWEVKVYDVSWVNALGERILTEKVRCNNLLNGAKFGGVIKSRNKWIKKDGYWIGIDCNGRKFKFSCNNKEIEKEILENTWCVDTTCAMNYVRCSSLGICMHTFIKKTLKGSVVDHINNDRVDNREENLRVVTVSENNRNRKTTRNNGSKYVGMVCTSSGKFYNVFKINGHYIATKSKIEEEAEIDNLIVQKHYNMRHNEEDFYRLENVSEERKLEVINLVEKKLKKKKKESRRISTNSYEYEDLGASIKVYFCEGKHYFLMDKNDMDKFNGYLEGGKFFVHGSFGKKNGGYVLYNKKGETYQIHRYILNLKDNDFVVDHKNHIRVDNRKCNLEIVTRLSNSQNKESKGYRFLKDEGRFVVQVGYQYKYLHFIGAKRTVRFSTEEEAKQEVARRKEIIDATRVRLKSLEELESLKRYTEENGFDNYDDAYLDWANVKERVDKINLKYLYTFDNNCI